MKLGGIIKRLENLTLTKMPDWCLKVPKMTHLHHLLLSLCVDPIPTALPVVADAIITILRVRVDVALIPIQRLVVGCILIPTILLVIPTGQAQLLHGVHGIYLLGLILLVLILLAHYNGTVLLLVHRIFLDHTLKPIMFKVRHHPLIHLHTVQLTLMLPFTLCLLTHRMQLVHGYRCYKLYHFLFRYSLPLF